MKKEQVIEKIQNKINGYQLEANNLTKYIPIKKTDQAYISNLNTRINELSYALDLVKEIE